MKKIIILLAALFVVASCGPKKVKTQDFIDSEEAFYAALSDTSKSISEISDQVYGYLYHLLEFAKDPSSRQRRLAAQEQAAFAISNLSTRAKVMEGKMNQYEGSVLIKLMKDLTLTFECWLTLDDGQNYHVAKEFPCVNEKSVVAGTGDYFFIDYLVPSKKQPQMRLVFRVPHNAVGNVDLVFKKTRVDTEQVEATGVHIGTPVVVDLPEAPQSPIISVSENVLDLMMNYQEMLISYNADNGTTTEKKVATVKLASFQEAVNAVPER